VDEAGRQQSQDQGAPLHCGPGATHEYFEAFDSYLPGALPLLAGVHLDQKKVLTREAAKQVAAAAIRFTAANKYKGDCGDMRRWRPPSLSRTSPIAWLRPTHSFLSCGELCRWRADSLSSSKERRSEGSGSLRSTPLEFNLDAKKENHLRYRS
jgi:hypothetical protein